MKTIKIVLAIVSISLFIACKVTEKKIVLSPKTYSEISIATGGKWIDGTRGHEEYSGGSFTNVQTLKVPKNHTDHSWYLRYEGPGWESNKIGYRLYLDWRNAIDIFGKVTDSMVLHKVGQDGFDSYHEPQSWGQDILKVGSGLGIGSIGRIVNDRMFHFKEVDSTFATIENSSKKSTVIIDYKGWKTADEKIDLTSILSIEPDSRITKHTIQSSKEITGIVTGIVNHKVTYLQKESSNKKWGYIATYGKQTLVPDNLGMAIFYEINTTSDVKKGEFDYLIEFKPTTKSIDFYFLAAWEKESNGIKTQEEFSAYLDGLLRSLNDKNRIE